MGFSCWSGWETGESMSGVRSAPTVKTVLDIVGRMVGRIEEVVRGTTIEELNKSLASVLEFVQCEKARKAEEERLKREAEEEEERKAAAKRACEKKERRRATKLQKEAERDTEMNKRMELQLAIKTNDFFYRMEANLGPTLELVQRKVKKQVTCTGMHSSEHEGSDSATEEIRTRTGPLTINEKRKRGPEFVFDDNPPMLTPDKRTTRRTKVMIGATPVRLTRAKGKVKTKVSPYLAKPNRSLEKPSNVTKLRYRNRVMEDLRGLDAQELQSICKTEGVVYNGKIDAVFDIASHKTRVAFGELEPVDLSSDTELDEEESANVDDEEHAEEE
ncbi:hypothetical protein CBR_g45530 [Chara braunii]|uniref:Uncharacterized protein n=1 Tax=Chara braunii TaxID=69332 RepID=A0A388LZ10_CHABU|nr:hypothetical protein CBR_g45530 [Chara braunii]|eukprot:GBG87472.1 hypothetical protein CBR_g45530 [Chara braunii]